MYIFCTCTFAVQMVMSITPLLICCTYTVTPLTPIASKDTLAVVYIPDIGYWAKNKYRAIEWATVYIQSLHSLWLIVSLNLHKCMDPLCWEQCASQHHVLSCRVARYQRCVKTRMARRNGYGSEWHTQFAFAAKRLEIISIQRISKMNRYRKIHSHSECLPIPG